MEVVPMWQEQAAVGRASENSFEGGEGEADLSAAGNDKIVLASATGRRMVGGRTSIRWNM